MELLCVVLPRQSIMVLPLMANMGVRKETLNFLGNRTMALGALFSEEAFHFLGVICSIFALALGSVSLVTSVEALQPFMTLIFVVVISLFKPGMLDEDLSPKALIQKFVSIIFVSVGIYFMF